jgi:hypothetical protein
LFHGIHTVKLLKWNSFIVEFDREEVVWHLRIEKYLECVSDHIIFLLKIIITAYYSLNIASAAA